MATQWQIFPRSLIPPEHLRQVVAAFESVNALLETPLKQPKSNEALAIVKPELELLGYSVESGKTAAKVLNRPVLFGLNGRPTKTFQVDAFHEATGTVVEGEAGGGVANHRFLKDLFEACAIPDAEYLVIAVMNEYLGGNAGSAKNFATVTSFLDTLYASGRLDLPLKAVLVIGY